MQSSKVKLVLFTLGTFVFGGLLGAFAQQKLAKRSIEMTSLMPSRSPSMRFPLIPKAIFPIKSLARSFRGETKLRLRSMLTLGL
jgi:hypothetical protein